MKKLSLISAMVLATPMMAFAQAPTVDITFLNRMMQIIDNVITTLLPIVISLAVLVFLWGVFKYVAAGDDEEARKSGRSLMINGIIAIFVMVSLWGLVNVLENFFGLNDTSQNAPNKPAYVPIT